MHLSSPAFAHETTIPTHYTSDGEDASPPLTWSDLPTGTRSLALIVDDPDAPHMSIPGATWVHWIVYNLSPETTGLHEDASGELPGHAEEGKNGWGHVGYGGPAPPSGTHRYIFTLYALDTELSGLAHPTKDELERAMAGRILATATLMGTYHR